jgi:hypothetical protein
MSGKRADAMPIGAPSERVTAPSLQGTTELDGDESSGISPAGAARAERDDEDEADTANDARSREELDGSLMANGALKNMVRWCVEMAIPTFMRGRTLRVGLKLPVDIGTLVNSSMDRQPPRENTLQLVKQTV